MSITRYPLCWPAGHKRTLGFLQRDARFFSHVKGRGAAKVRRDVTISEAVQRVLDELGAYNPKGHTHCDPATVIISTNVETRRDGLPAGNAKEPADGGAAVYFVLDSRPYCLPCDTYRRLADNLAAIAATIEGMRTIARHGVVSSADVFTNFAALPPAQLSAPRSCWEVLGMPPTKDKNAISTVYRSRAAVRHPDVATGSTEKMQELNAARDEANAFADKP